MATLVEGITVTLALGAPGVTVRPVPELTAAPLLLLMAPGLDRVLLELMLPEGEAAWSLFEPAGPAGVAALPAPLAPVCGPPPLAAAALPAPVAPAAPPVAWAKTEADATVARARIRLACVRFMETPIEVLVPLLNGAAASPLASAH
jgi:hypothetical protein